MIKNIKDIPVKNLLTLAVVVFALLLVGRHSFAQLNPQSQAAQTYEAVVKEIVVEEEHQAGGYYQELKVQILTGDFQGQTLEAENGLGDTPVSQKFRPGDKLLVTGFRTEDGTVKLFVSDYIRKSALLSLVLVFFIGAILVAGKRGVFALVGMAVTFVLIFTLVLPKISSGANAVLVSIVFSLIVIPVTFYLSHGFNNKTHVAIVGTVVSLIITVVLAGSYIQLAKLTGFTSDEASFLQVQKGGLLNMRGLLLAGIIVGVLGVLDDITVSQSAVVFQLKSANRRLTFYELYRRSMEVGKDHIASMLNTLILVYAGATLPLLLLFTDTSKTYGEVINYEIVASEIVRTLVGSIGLMLAVPITTFVACAVVDATD